MSSNFVKNILPSFAAASASLAAISHLFCCGIPLALNLASLTSVFGASTLQLDAFQWLKQYELQVIIFGGVLIGLSGISQLVSKRVSCVEHECTPKDCSTKKRLSLSVFQIASILYSVNLSVFLFYTPAH